MEHKRMIQQDFAALMASKPATKIFETYDGALDKSHQLIDNSPGDKRWMLNLKGDINISDS